MVLLVALPSAVVRVTVRLHPREVAVDEMLIQMVALSPSSTTELLFSVSKTSVPTAEQKLGHLS